MRAKANLTTPWDIRSVRASVNGGRAEISASVETRSSVSGYRGTFLTSLRISATVLDSRYTVSGDASPIRSWCPGNWDMALWMGSMPTGREAGRSLTADGLARMTGGAADAGVAVPTRSLLGMSRNK